MDFIELLKIMLRRWWVVLPVLAVAAVVGTQLVGESEQLYTSSGSELLIRADAEDLVTASGPLSPSEAGSVLASALDQQGYRGSLEDRGLVSNYTVEANVTSTVLTVAITGASPEAVLATGEAMVAEVQELLASVVGSDVPTVRVTSVSPPTEGDVVSFGARNSLTTAFALLQTNSGALPFPPSAATVRTLLDLADRPAVREAVAAVAPEADFSVTADPRDAAAIVDVTVTTPIPSNITPAYRAVVDALQIEIDALQNIYGVLAGEGTAFSTLSPPVQVTQTSSSEVRVVAGIALVALAIACGLAILTDTLIGRRRSRREVAVEQS